MNPLNSLKTTVDWLRFRAKEDPRDILEAIRPLYGDTDLADAISFGPLQKGILGFKQALPIMLADIPIGRIDSGGESQRDWSRVDLTGVGCEWMRDLSAIGAIEALKDSQIRRIDLALTTWDGEVTHDRVVQAHAAGRFITRRPPVLRQITSSDPRAGKTCYIGKREQSDKFMRCYEKGFEIAAKYASRSPGEIVGIDGKALEDIYRCEVEFKAVGTDIPWEIIERRDQYFAGAYPFCADVLPGIEADILMRRPERAPQIGLKAALDNLRIQFGPTIYTALHAYHGDWTTLCAKIIGDHHNQTLVEAGVLMVEHD